MDVTTILIWVQTVATVVFVPLAGMGVAWVRRTNDTLMSLRLELAAVQGRMEERGRSLDECRLRDREDHSKLFGRLDKHTQAIVAIAAAGGSRIPDLG